MIGTPHKNNLKSSLDKKKQCDTLEKEKQNKTIRIKLNSTVHRLIGHNEREQKDVTMIFLMCSQIMKIAKTNLMCSVLPVLKFIRRISTEKNKSAAQNASIVTKCAHRF